MNYVELHIGDYEKATTHLTATEDGIYGRLLRRYYDTEAPLPLDIKAVQRLTRARSREEKEAVETVLGEFFVESDDGWRHKRCDEEIRRYDEKRAKAKANVEKRWERVRNGYDRNTDVSDPYAVRNTHQSPVTNHQSPEDQEQASPSSTAAPSTDLLGANHGTVDLTTARAQRLAQVTSEAIETFNASGLVKANGGLLASVSPTVGRERRQQQVGKCIRVAKAICQENYSSPTITREFWVDYWAECLLDEHKSGRKGGGKDNPNWVPTFEYLTREKTMLEIYDKVSSEDAA